MTDVKELVERLRHYVRQVHPTAHICACRDIEAAADALSRPVADIAQQLHDRLAAPLHPVADPERGEP